MNLRSFVNSLIAIILSILSFFLLYSFFTLPMLILARYGFPSADMQIEGLIYLIVALLVETVLFVALYLFLVRALSELNFISKYYVQIYKTFVATLMVASWLLPTICLFFPFNLILVFGIVLAVVVLIFVVITILLKDVLFIVDSNNTISQVQTFQEDVQS